MRIFVVITLMLLMSVNAAPALACSPLTTASLRYSSDVVVWGEYFRDEDDLQGAIKVRRTEKGRKIRALKVRWELGSVDEDGVEINDGVGCPRLPRLIDGDRARFFLRREADERYLVVGYDHVQEKEEN